MSRVLELFAGHGGWSAPWAEAGHEVVTLDFDPVFETTIVADILEVPLTDFHDFQVVLASPPCETWSIASLGHHWGTWPDGSSFRPKTPEAEVGIAILKRTVELIEYLDPRIALIENPRGAMRKSKLIPYDRRTVWYCHYGVRHAKPTDLWVRGFQMDDNLCHNRKPGHPDYCCCHDHDAAPRGAKTGTQGIGTYAERSDIPRQLAEEVMQIALTHLPEGAP